jgi:hypothetical protein
VASGLGGDEGILLSQLVSGEISEEEVLDNVVLLVFAAHDTTSFAIAMTFKMLADHPDCHSLLLQGTLCFQYFRLQRKFPKSEGHPKDKLYENKYNSDLKVNLMTSLKKRSLPMILLNSVYIITLGRTLLT